MKIKYLFILTVIRNWRRNCGYTEYKFILTSTITGSQFRGICDGGSEVLGSISNHPLLKTTQGVYFTEEPAVSRKAFKSWGGGSMGHPSRDQLQQWISDEIRRWPVDVDELLG